MNKPRTKRYELYVLVYCIILIVISILFLNQCITVKIGILNYIGGLFFLGYLYHFLFYLPNFTFQKYYLFFLFVGVISRVLLSFSVPLWEDDYARYLWEGNLISKGISPYMNSPESYFKEFSISGSNDKEMEILSRINHPDWTAIYSPVVLLYFYFCSLISPFSLLIIKLGYIFFDILVVWMIQSIRNKKTAVLYFLFPVLLKEIYINSHFEIITISLCIASIWLNKKSYINISSLLYGIAVHSKIYLLFIFPYFLIRNSLDNKINHINYFKLFQFILYFLLGIILPTIIFESKVENNSYYGLDVVLKFANEFEFNSLYFTLLKKGLGAEKSRLLVLLFSLFYILYSIFNYKNYFLNLHRGLLWVYNFFLLSLLFSPIVNPWYFLILIPFYLLALPKKPLNWMVILVPQVSYFTFVNLNITSEYKGFYNIEESIIVLETISITGLILLSYFHKRVKNLN